MVWALSEIHKIVETAEKVFPVAFGFALDLGFNILPLIFCWDLLWSFFPGLGFLALNEISFFKRF